MIDDWSTRRKITIIFAVFAISFVLSASLNMAQTIPAVGNCTDSSTLNITTNSDYRVITCPYGCIENASQYGDDCKIPEIERTDEGMATSGLIGLAIMMFAMFYIAMSIGEGERGEYKPLQWLLFGMGVIFGWGVLNSATILSENTGQDVLAGQLGIIYGGYVVASVFIGFYFGYLFIQWVVDRMNPKKEDDDD